jgi:uncharacterized protein YndB with AHSA1/START domain
MSQEVPMLLLLTLALGTAAAPTAAAGAEPSLVKDRDPGAHVIGYDLTVEAPPEEVFRLWSTEAGVRRFLAPGARIEGRVGELYQITFDPDTDPEGAQHGTKGARLLHLDPPRAIAFEWTFPPLGPKLNTPPFPTWVEVQLEPAAGRPGRTRVHFAHYGFPDDPDWRRAYKLFNDGNWPLVLNRLVVACRDGLAPAWDDPDGDHLDRWIRKQVTVAAPVGAVWKAWTTVEGLRFIAEGARIEPVPGGPYEWYFSMDAPEGQRGGEGNTVLAVDPPRSLTFEWNAPPSLPNVRKQRHVVQVELTSEGEAATRVVVTALGFGTGEEWRATHAYFEKAWASVLGRLQAHFAE